jgi:hypothetical protein
MPSAAFTLILGDILSPTTVVESFDRLITLCCFLCYALRCALYCVYIDSRGYAETDNNIKTFLDFFLSQIVTLDYDQLLL